MQLENVFSKINVVESCPWDKYFETMVYTDFCRGAHEKKAVKSFFYRTPPFGGACAYFGGLSEFLCAVKSFSYSEAAKVMKESGLYSSEFLNYLKNRDLMNVKIYAIKEGSAIFPHEPVVVVEGDLIDVRFIEGMMHVLNRGSLFLTKWRRVVEACGDRPVFDFSRRRAQSELHSSLYALMAGVAGTSNCGLSGFMPVNLIGTMGHEFVQSFSNEFEAFDMYLQVNPSNPVLLIDTVDPLKSGMPNAIAAFKKHENRIKAVDAWEKCAVRNDSGDLVYLAVEEIKMLDAAGFSNVGIVQTNDLDEYVISSMKSQFMQFPIAEATRMLDRITYACGTRPGVAYDTPAFGGVAKLCELDGKPVMKLTLNNPEKASIPGNTRSALAINSNNEIMCCVIFPHGKGVTVESNIATVYDKDDSSRYLRLHTAAGRLEFRHQLVYASGKFYTASATIQSVLSNVQQASEQIGWYSRRLQNPNKIKVSLSKELFNLRAMMKSKNSVVGDYKWCDDSMV